MRGVTVEQIRRHLVGLKMPRALEVLQSTLAGIEQGDVSVLQAIESCWVRSTARERAGASRWRYIRRV
jgi:hypothetical protein